MITIMANNYEVIRGVYGRYIKKVCLENYNDVRKMATWEWAKLG